jgi:hypothetical protein
MNQKTIAAGLGENRCLSIDHLLILVPTQSGAGVAIINYETIPN